jgi:hypothetical protein
VLTWNDDSLCCVCRDKEEETGPKDRRSKIPASDYGHILALREIGWTYRELAELYGANSNYLCQLITAIRKRLEG